MQMDMKVINDAIICDEKTIIFILLIVSDERTIIFISWIIWFCRNPTTKSFFCLLIHSLKYLSNKYTVICIRKLNNQFLIQPYVILFISIST